MEIIAKYQIRPEHLNHHHTLYAGQIADWLIEAAYVEAVTLWKRTDHIVMAGANHIQMLRPMRLGDVMVLKAGVARLGRTSIVLNVEGTELLSGERCAYGEFVFVTIDDEGHKAPHGLTLEE